MPSYENVNYNNSTKNVSMLGTNYVSKGVSDLETCMDYFALPGRSCEILNFCLTAQTAQSYQNWEVSPVYPKFVFKGC